ncbi:MAG: hypothetical protein Q9181_006219 [Wetmoreana brouardii]
MATTYPKRRHNNAYKKVTKKRKLANDESQMQVRSSKATAVNALPWNEVPLPDRLDNAEGFFGLEEISDVEVVKDEKHGRVEYRHIKPTATADLRKGQEAEWTGFEDSAPATDDDSSSSGLMSRASQALSSRKREKSNDEQFAENLEDLAEDAPFRILKNVLDEEEGPDGEPTASVNTVAFANVDSLCLAYPGSFSPSPCVARKATIFRANTHPIFSYTRDTGRA